MQCEDGCRPAVRRTPAPPMLVNLRCEPSRGMRSPTRQKQATAGQEHMYRYMGEFGWCRTEGSTVGGEVIKRQGLPWGSTCLKRQGLPYMAGGDVLPGGCRGGRPASTPPWPSAPWTPVYMSGLHRRGGERRVREGEGWRDGMRAGAKDVGKVADVVSVSELLHQSVLGSETFPALLSSRPRKGVIQCSLSPSCPPTLLLLLGSCWYSLGALLELFWGVVWLS